MANRCPNTDIRRRPVAPGSAQGQSTGLHRGHTPCPPMFGHTQACPAPQGHVPSNAPRTLRRTPPPNPEIGGPPTAPLPST